MPSDIDIRRLRDGLRALELSIYLNNNVDGPVILRENMRKVDAGIVALQSLDDLGSELENRWALDSAAILQTRYEQAERRLLKFEADMAAYHVTVRSAYHRDSDVDALLESAGIKTTAGVVTQEEIPGGMSYTFTPTQGLSMDED